jgi:hypothetical protein
MLAQLSDASAPPAPPLERLDPHPSKITPTMRTIPRARQRLHSGGAPEDRRQDIAPEGYHRPRAVDGDDSSSFSRPPHGTLPVVGFGTIDCGDFSVRVPGDWRVITGDMESGSPVTLALPMALVRCSFRRRDTFRAPCPIRRPRISRGCSRGSRSRRTSEHLAKLSARTALIESPRRPSR